MSTCEVSKFEEGRDIVLLSIASYYSHAFQGHTTPPQMDFAWRREERLPGADLLNMHKTIHIFNDTNKDVMKINLRCPNSLSF